MPDRPLAAPRQAPLALDPAVFREAGHALVDRLADFLAGLGQGKVTAGERPMEIRDALGTDGPLPDTGTDPVVLLRDTTEQLIAHSLFNGHPQFYGYITSSPSHIGMLGDFLAAAMNPNVGAHRLSPAASEIEGQAIRWICELLRYPTSAGGLFVSGGNMANIVALMVARAHATEFDREHIAGWDPKAATRVYASTETHTWLQKATELSGLGNLAVEWIPADATGRMDAQALRSRLASDRAKGIKPMMVVATAGTVGTGAIDPLRSIANICYEFGAWMHVDGAYGAFAAAIKDPSPEFEALELADSVAVDPHKWLYAPLEAGCVLVRDARALWQTFTHSPSYYEFDTDGINYHELGPQNSRGFRALKVWLGLRQVGRRGYEQMIGDDIRLSERLRDNLEAHPSFTVFTQSLSITTFCYVPEDLAGRQGDTMVVAYLDELNRELLESLQISGEAFVSNAMVNGRYALRACIVNFNTGPEHVDALPGIIARHGARVDRVMPNRP